jgi:hypothetical protein
MRMFDGVLCDRNIEIRSESWYAMILRLKGIPNKMYERVRSDMKGSEGTSPPSPQTSSILTTLRPDELMLR